MEYTRFGQTELHVSRLSFGTWAFGGDWGAVQVEAARAAIRRAHDLGINFFDTAQAYGFGAAERLLGEALEPEIKGHRHELVLATVEEPHQFAGQRELPLGQLAIAWTLAHPAVDVTIVGARTPAQIEQTAPAASVHLGPADLAEIDRIMGHAVPMGGPAPETV